MKGKLVLVGAGPGDPELLTLKAVRALASADVVLVDDLVDRRVLAHVRPGARIVDVGKRGGCPSTPQQWITRLAVREARAGRTVVRLKGGDPFVFGRGGEERQAALRAGIDVEVVGGITSGIAAAAASGIPLTHREAAQGAILVTGHAAAGNAIDWAVLAATRMTLVVYMGVARAGEIAGGLLAARVAPDTPVAIVEGASLPGERTTLATLGTLAATIARQRIASPAILIVGDVVRYAMRSSASATASHSASSLASDHASSPCRASAALSRSLASSA